MSQTNRQLKNKTVLITDSVRGIGQATAELFHKKGATVTISDISIMRARQLLKGQ